jgi:hypothetical protein
VVVVLELLGLVMFLVGFFGLIVAFLIFACFRPVRQALIELIFPSSSAQSKSSLSAGPRQRIPSRKEQLEIARSGRCLHCQGECTPEIRLIFQSCQRCWVRKALRKETIW